MAYNNGNNSLIIVVRLLWILRGSDCPPSPSCCWLPMWAWCAREAVVPPDEGERSINEEVKSAYDAAVIEISRENSWNEISSVY